MTQRFLPIDPRRQRPAAAEGNGNLDRLVHGDLSIEIDRHVCVILLAIDLGAVDLAVGNIDFAPGCFLLVFTRIFSLEIDGRFRRISRVVALVVGVVEGAALLPFAH